MKKGKSKKTKSNEKINLGNEIIIGLTPKKEEIKNEKLKKKKKTKPKKQKKQKAQKEQKKTVKKQKKKLNFHAVKWTGLVIAAVALVVLLLMSSIFNIKRIEIANNNIISEEEIIRLSGIELDTNMFKYSKKNIKNNLKKNAYIEDVKVKRKINGTVILTIEERTPTYMLKFANSYVYINNQGYVLEISENPIEVPTITGYETQMDNIKEGDRLIVSDLQKLADVIKIMTSATETDFASLITSIDITSKTNYILTLASENKIVQFGETTNINVKILKIKEVLEREKGITGEIYFQDSERTIFKETV